MWSYYHYTRPQIAKVPRLEHVREQVVDRVVYFPRPSELNDDLDCRPRMLRPSEAQAIWYGVRRGGANYPGQGRRRERAKRKNWMEHRMGNRVLLQQLWAKSAERYGVLSLSKRNTNDHLWGAYAAGRSGVCIEYNFEHIIDSRLIDWLFFEVEYAAAIPQLNILDFQRPEPALVEEFIRRSFRAKTLKWAAEEEVRVVFQVDDLVPPKVRVPPHTISALYLGPSIAEPDRAAILCWRTGIPIYQAIVGLDGQFTFKLVRAAGA